MSRLGGVYRDENVVCSTTCEIYIPSSIPESGTSAVKCELHSFGRCDVYLIQTTALSQTKTGSILDIPGQQKVRMDLDLNNILADNLHYMTKDQYWYEFSRRYGAVERCVTVHFCKEDEHCDRFLELLHVTFSTLEECRRRNIKPEHSYRLIAFEIVGRISIASSTASEAVGRERSGGYTYEMPWDCVLDVHLGREERSLEEEHAIFTHIVHKKSISKPKTVDLDDGQIDGALDSLLDKLKSRDTPDRYLQCQKCFEPFARDFRRPRLLPCLHTLCSKCLDEANTVDTVQCPVCDTRFNIVDVEKDCPEDLTRFDILDFRNLNDENYRLNCSVCPDKVATHRCIRCAEWLCPECQEAHQRVTATKKHALSPIDDIKRGKKLDVFKRNVICKRHSENSLKFYCTAEPCMEPVCATCLLEKCEEMDRHKAVEIENIARVKRQQVYRLKNAIHEKQKNVAETIERIEIEKKSIEDTAHRVAENIDSTFESLMKVLEKNKIELKTELQKVAKTKLEMLEEQTTGLVALKKQMEDAEDVTDCVLVSPNSVAFMQTERIVLKRLDKLATGVYEASPRELPTFGFYDDSLESKLEQVVAHSAQIWSSSISPGKSVTIVDETYWEDDSVRFTVIPQDYRGIPIKIDSAVMRATIKDPKGNTISCVLTPRQDDYSLIDVTADVSGLGRHLLSVYMGETIVASAEFDRTRVYLRSTLPLGQAQKVISLDLDETDA